MSSLHVIVTVVMALAGSVAEAATVYRCGHEYTDVACARGGELVVGATPSGQRLAEARPVATSKKPLAAEMTRDRREQEALAKPALAGSLSAPRAAAAAPPAAARKNAKKHDRKAAIDAERDFVAAVPKAKKAGS